MSGQEKTHDATPQRMRDLRKKGGLGKSRDLSAWLGMAVAMALIPAVVVNTGEAAHESLMQVATVAADPTAERALAALDSSWYAVIDVLLPMFAVLVLVMVVTQAAQGGVHPHFRLHVESLNVGKGVKRLFSGQTLWEGVKTLAKSVAVGLVVYASLRAMIPSLMSSGRLSLDAVVEMASESTVSLLKAGIAAGLALAFLDLAVVIKRNRKQTRMTLQEVKDESKRSEGDPLLKSAIRARQRAMTRNRMMAAVADADVVVVNPTHVAVALRYQPGLGAPKVVAKGADDLARKIRELAASNRVPMVSDIPLARALYASCEIDQEIPEYLFMAVARVLAFVMALRRKGAAAGEHRTPGGTTLPQYVDADYRRVAREQQQVARVKARTVRRTTLALGPAEPAHPDDIAEVS